MRQCGGACRRHDERRICTTRKSWYTPANLLGMLPAAALLGRVADWLSQAAELPISISFPTNNAIHLTAIAVLADASQRAAA
jgi:HKD family nuclease